MISGLPGFNAENVRIQIRELDSHDYDLKKPQAAEIASYDSDDVDLLKEVEETRNLVQQSFFSEVELSETGVQIQSLTLVAIAPVIVEEINTLNGLIEDQLGYLGVSREYSFKLGQNSNGDILVESRGPEELPANISEKLNSSEHFKETFHLLKTAEKVLANDMAKDVNDRLHFELSLSPDSISSNISLDKTHDSPQSITDLEMYHLARYGMAARKTQTVYLKV